MLGSRDVARNAVNWYHAPQRKLIMGLCCNSACKKCETASRREGDAGQGTCRLWIKRESGWLFEELQLDEVMVFMAKLVTFLVVCGICVVTWVSSLKSICGRLADK